MPVPDLQTFKPLLWELLKDEKEHSNKEIIEYISNHFHLTLEERKGYHSLSLYNPLGLI